MTASLFGGETKYSATLKLKKRKMNFVPKNTKTSHSFINVIFYKFALTKGLTLEMSAFCKLFHRGNSTFINWFDKTQFLRHFPSDAAPQFLLKLEIHLLMKLWFTVRKKITKQEIQVTSFRRREFWK